ncbi:hypothetical protein TNCV_115851 [Trichonephila clavipes]|nr:hypothetical protein TNCV_115851 [Trichonephila clavipes]
MRKRPTARCKFLVSPLFLYFSRILETGEHKEPTSHAVLEILILSLGTIIIYPLSNSLKPEAFPLTHKNNNSPEEAAKHHSLLITWLLRHPDEFIEKCESVHNILARWKQWALTGPVRKVRWAACGPLASGRLSIAALTGLPVYRTGYRKVTTTGLPVRYLMMEANSQKQKNIFVARGCRNSSRIREKFKRITPHARKSEAGRTRRGIFNLLPH